MKKFIRHRSDKKVLTVNLAVRYNTGFLSNYSGFQTLRLNLGICYQKSRNKLVTKNLLHQHRAVFLTQIVENNDLIASNPLNTI